MNNIAKLGLAAVLLIGGTAITSAEDIAAPKAGVSAGANMGVDATTTGGLGNYGALISTLQAGAVADLSAWTESSTVSFVTVSSLQGQAGANAEALDNALNKNPDAMTSLHASIEGNAALKAKIEAAGHAVDDVIAVQTGADGSFTFYVDDRA